MREGGGEGPGFVSMRDLEDQILLEAVVVPEVLRMKNATGQLQPCFSMLAKQRTHLLGPREVLAHRTGAAVDPDAAAGAFAVAPDPGDRAGRADGAAALRLAVAATAADGARRQGRVRRAAAARDLEAGDTSTPGRIDPVVTATLALDRFTFLGVRHLDGPPVLSSSWTRAGQLVTCWVGVRPLRPVNSLSLNFSIFFSRLVPFFLGGLSGTPPSASGGTAGGPPVRPGDGGPL